MAKFMILYNADASPREVMANASPEAMRASMDEWIAWRNEASKTIKIDFGMPMQVVGRVAPEGLTDSDTRVTGYAFVEGESKEVVQEVLRTHPHLKRDGASIDVLEVLSMPGL
jgi:hypothetical protein